MKTIAIDFEAANKSRTSICAIGLVVIEGGAIVRRKSWLVRPYPFLFDRICVRKHGITEDKVKNEPTFDRVWNDVLFELSGSVIIAHNAASTEVNYLRNTLGHYGIEVPEIDVYCTLQIAKKVWPNMPRHSLDVLAEELKISFKHHDAEDDAAACAQVLIRACVESKADGVVELASMLKLRPKQLRDSYETAVQSTQKVKPRRREMTVSVSLGLDEPIAHHFFDKSTIERSPLAGLRLVVTGTLEKFSRDYFEKLIKELGGRVSGSVSKKTDYVVVGEDAGSKLEKAKALGVKTLSEGEFLKMVER